MLVLPAPLGPMMAWTEPLSTAKLTSSRAVTPPKRSVTSLTSSCGTTPGTPMGCVLLPDPAVIDLPGCRGDGAGGHDLHVAAHLELLVQRLGETLRHAGGGLGELSELAELHEVVKMVQVRRARHHRLEARHLREALDDFRHLAGVHEHALDLDRVADPPQDARELRGGAPARACTVLVLAEGAEVAGGEADQGIRLVEDRRHHLARLPRRDRFAGRGVEDLRSEE